MKIPNYKMEDLPPPGSVFTMPLADGRFGVVRVIRKKLSGRHPMVYVVPSSWIGVRPDRPSDHDIRAPLCLTHHAWRGRRDAHWMMAPPPPDFVAAGTIALTAEDDLLQTESYAHWEGFPQQILSQWRWDHDRENVLREDAARREKEIEEKRLAAERRAERLRTLTLASLAARSWFDSWDEALDAPHVESSRKLIADLIKDLSSEPKITKAIARRRLKATVVGFNQIDNQARFIETTHREDICEALELIACAAKHPELADEIDRWRDW